MITVQNLCKTYKVAKRKAGMREACRSLFRREYEEIHALDHISFRLVTEKWLDTLAKMELARVQQLRYSAVF